MQKSFGIYRASPLISGWYLVSPQFLSSSRTKRFKKLVFTVFLLDVQP